LPIADHWSSPIRASFSWPATSPMFQLDQVVGGERRYDNALSATDAV
jgi:hypothetical protein